MGKYDGLIENCLNADYIGNLMFDVVSNSFEGTEIAIKGMVGMTLRRMGLKASAEKLSLDSGQNITEEDVKSILSFLTVDTPCQDGEVILQSPPVEQEVFDREFSKWSGLKL